MNKFFLVTALCFISAIQLFAQQQDIAFEDKKEVNSVAITTISTADKKRFETFPEVVSNQFFLKCNWETSRFGILDFIFFDQQGKVAHREQKAVSIGTQTLMFDVSTLPVGIYSVMTAQRDWSRLMENCLLKTK